MKFFVSLVLTALLSFACSLFFPWWSVAIAAFVVAALIHQKPYKAFLAAFFALFILWGLQAWWIDLKNEHILSTKVAAILPLGGSPYALIALSALVGALVSGMSALTGSYLRKVV